MKKVLVIGSGGSGKSTFARHLGGLLDIEVIHLDKIYWHRGWVETPKTEWLKTVDRLLERDAWIMDGNFSGSLERRLVVCDTVIFLDMPRSLCVWRVLKRAVIYRKRSRPDMALGCAERLDPEFIRWVWNYSKRTRPKVVARLAAHEAGKKIITLRSRYEVEEYLAQIAPNNSR
jgi:adenylate kinase family enzyme